MISVANETLLLTLNPQVGGTITEIRHAQNNLSVLGSAPWDTQTDPPATLAPRDEVEWLTGYTGGWPQLFPRGRHQTFGSDLLAEPVEIPTGADRVTADEACDPTTSPLQPGGRGRVAAMDNRAMMIGIKSNSTTPAYGLAQAKAKGGQLPCLTPSTCYHAWLRLNVFHPQGPIRSCPP